MDRRGLLRQHIDIETARVLEIGALAVPLVAPHEARVEYVDHLDTEGLRREYRGHPGVDVDKLVDVTYVWNGGTFAEAVGAAEPFDAIVSSHVFEHFPNPVQWLADAYSLLAPGGQIYMVVPDMRFTFDRHRAKTRTADWIEWYLEKPSRPSTGQVYDYHSKVVDVPPGYGWAQEPAGGFANIYDPSTALEQARSAFETGRYIDAHCSVFTPVSLLALFREIDDLNLFPFDVTAVYPTEVDDIEFALVLKRSDVPPRPQLSREIDQQLAREAGYTGEFGAGGFAAALAADPELQKRHNALKRQWAAEAIRNRKRAALPELDPTRHDAFPPRDDPRLARRTSWFQRLRR
ncbi:class I SAM-dependent methyltransferase [Thalassobaculum salexigens]|uniref:class I SAM-dependent methyltransferase n=1 Tax=Thalassobaculum salexigens TaxID=455360 RepID=UPI00248D873C|nr:class I SAM-dependent methyltransferase [Thalassobaculum salexigens]